MVSDKDWRNTARFTLALGATLLLGACSLWSPKVDDATQSTVATNAKAGMTMTDARTNLESSGFRCHTRTGSYFDEAGDEHALSGAFVSCTKLNDRLFRFACGQRPHVVLVPNGTRVARVIVDTTPVCTNPRPAVSQRPQYP
ncbi:MAG TPA: hypothetical protein VFQ88_04835 [Nevskiaceae bacterium]|nr:hypothetical protein [Nevskiaceae bacterium]